MAYDSHGTVNKVILIGRCGADPELKYTSSGAAVLTIDVATNTSYKGQDGNAVENTEWSRCVFWRKLAEMIAQYAKKGSKIYIEGKLATRSWEDQNSVKRYTTEIQVENAQLLDKREGSDRQADQTEPSEPSTPDEQDDLPF